jgi:hypothetical protein
MHRHWFGMSDEGYLNMDIQMGFSCVILFHVTDYDMDDQTDLCQCMSMLLFLDSTVIAHAGDGNFHTVILFDPTKEEERKEAERLNNFMVHAALLLEGIDNTLLLIHVAC